MLPIYLCGWSMFPRQCWRHLLKKVFLT